MWGSILLLQGILELTLNPKPWVITGDTRVETMGHIYALANSALRTGLSMLREDVCNAYLKVHGTYYL